MSIPKLLFPRTFPLFRRPPTLRGFAVFASRPPGPPPTILPSHIPIEEETVPFYDPKYFLPVNPGDLLNNRYKILVKVGFGSTSTVWLAHNTQEWWCVTVKVTASNPADEETARHERILTSYLEKNPSHEGCKFVRKMLDRFEISGEEGPHLCLVYEPTREPLWIYKRRWVDRKISLVLLKLYLKFILQGLDYLHSECHVIHTDLKEDNILLTFENPSVLEDFLEQQAGNPMPRKIKNGQSIYLSHNDFGRLRSFGLVPKIVDFGLAQSGGHSHPLMHPIQVDVYRAPEVLLGTFWRYKADIYFLLP